ncbi:MAG: nucleotidyl transferase AbiEii/AbiGii toxin family protein [Deltaproteobacteria bacterium]|nr:nucleotidyl transferase AbiEii/AbiGii toxin family protein [Deltaproteobacteria bacterium]
MDDPAELAGKNDTMKPLRTRLQEARKQRGLPWEVLERDYLLSWILAGLMEVGTLKETLIFKGGTALKKCYFGDYRFSEDLDFSGLEGVPTGEAMKIAVEQACASAKQLLEEYAPVEIVCERYTAKDPHPSGQEAFTIRARFPWQRELHTRVMIETAIDETVLMPPRKKKILHEYGEPFNAHIQVYALEEIIAEKLRAILQHMEKLERRGWSRSRARDYYDLWRVLGTYKTELELSDFSSFLRDKCAIRNVTFKGPEDFFQDTMLAYVEKTWESWLGPLVPNLPPFQTVINELRPQIVEFIAFVDAGGASI